MSIQAIVAQYQPNNISDFWKEYKALQSKYEKYSRITFKNAPWWVGAIGTKHLGTVGSLAGMAVGGFVGSYVPELVFNKVTSSKTP